MLSESLHTLLCIPAPPAQADAPFTAGFKERHQIYTLYHYLNHYNLFGGGYSSSCENILNSLTRKL